MVQNIKFRFFLSRIIVWKKTANLSLNHKNCNIIEISKHIMLVHYLEVSNSVALSPQTGPGGCVAGGLSPRPPRGLDQCGGYLSLCYNLVTDHTSTTTRCLLLPLCLLWIVLGKFSCRVSTRVFRRGVKIKKSKLLQCRASLGGSQNWNPKLKISSKKYFL